MRRNLRWDGRWLAVLAAIVGTALPSRVSATDWALWLGPRQDATFDETGWLKDWPETGPPELFRIPGGEGYSSVIVVGEHLIFFHRVRGQMHVDDLDPETGDRRWRFSYDTDYVDAWGYSGGPRCCPQVDVTAEKKLVYTLGPNGILHAIELESGRKAWRRDLLGEYSLTQNFFGVGAAPALHGGRLYVNLGGTMGVSGLTLALEARTGETVWKEKTAGGSYAAARVVPVAGVDRLFVFHRGGMACFDPVAGRRKWDFPWRSRKHESVNASTPLVVGDKLLFSATYGTGAVALRLRADDYDVLWKDDLLSREKILDSHWSTIVCVDDHVYGFAGRHEGQAQLHCVELATGRVKWRWRSPLGRGTFIYGDGHFIALGERGQLYLLRLTPEGHKIVAEVPDVLDWPAWAVPTFSGGRLYVRDERKLIAFDLRTKRGEAKPSRSERESGTDGGQR